MKKTLSLSFRAVLDRPIRVIAAFLIGVIVFAGIRIAGFRPIDQPGTASGYMYFSFNIWMLPIAILFLGWFVWDTLWSARKLISDLREEGVSDGELFVGFLIPLLLFALLITVASNNIFRLYAAYIYNTYHHLFVSGLRLGPSIMDGWYENFFNYETFSVTVAVPLATVLIALAASLPVLKKVSAGGKFEKKHQSKFHIFGVVSTCFVCAIAFYNLANMFAAPATYPSELNRPDFSFAPYLVAIAVLLMIYLAVDTIWRARDDIEQMQADGQTTVKIYLKRLAPLAIFAIAISCVAFGGHLFYLSMNHKLEPYRALVGFGQSAVTMTTLSFPAYVPDAATWLTVFLIPLAVLVISGAVTLFVLQHRKKK